MKTDGKKIKAKEKGNTQLQEFEEIHRVGLEM